MYVNSKTGDLYDAPMGPIPGDLEATPDQVTAWQAKQQRAQLDALSVSAFQAMAAMSMAQGNGITDFDLLAKANAVVAAATNPIVGLAWNKCIAFNRQSPLILQLAASIPLTSDQLDQLFLLAQSISV